MASIFLRETILLSLLLNSSLAFFTRKNEKSPVPSPNKSCRLKSLQQSFAVQRNNEDGTLKPGPTTLCGSRISIESYQHKDFKLTYLHKRPAPGRENDKPIILIHPVGVGLASWFWIKLMEAFEDNPPIYAPDLIGCGLDHGADPWDPDKTGLFFPLSWVEGIETLIQTVILPSCQGGKPSWKEIFHASNSGDDGCLVVVQGGLAPVGILLTNRNPLAISALMLTSPPTYNDVSTAVPQDELERNYNFLRSPIFGSLAFSLLENKEIIRFFSNLFLFSEDCDEQWLDKTQQESRFVEARTPVQVFNAGFLQHRSCDEELKDCTQPKMIVSGDGDKRVVDRELYATEIRNCTLKTIAGTNVLPWENPQGTIELIKEMDY